jgi:oxygen-independent coproporphyrinogen-3 oxidase
MSREAEYRQWMQQAAPWLSFPAPRYTSYPSAQHFEEAVPQEKYARWLAELPERTPLGLYVHIPFCEKMCWFCGCHTRMTRRYEPVAAYLDEMEKEIALFTTHAARMQLSALHFGGGSPTLLTLRDLGAVMRRMREHFSFAPHPEFALEIDPRGFSRAKAEGYAALGINRVSLGVQDTNEAVQKAIGRIQPWETVEHACAWLREAGIHRINLDLVYGLPHQTLARLLETITRVIAVRPPRIALFSYAHVPWVKKHQRLIDEAWLPSPEEKYRMFLHASDALEAAGYAAVGIDHFALPEDPLATAWREGTLRRNFMGYVADGAEAVLGLGISSISQLPQGYAQNTLRHAEYARALAEGRFPLARGYHMTDEDTAAKILIDALMCTLEADAGTPPEALRPLEEAGILSLDGGKVRVFPQFRMLARVAAAAFDRHLDTRKFRYSRVA